MSIRTFIAVEVPADVRDRAADLCDRLRASRANVKWTRPDNMHITLKFLGDIDDAEVVEVCASIKAAAQKHESFSIFLAGGGAFPKPDRPRTLWVGVRDGDEELLALHKSVDDSLRELGFPREPRRYHPHLTLGRVRNSGNQEELAELLAANERFEAGAARIGEVVVYASYLDKGGPSYDALARCPLT